MNNKRLWEELKHFVEGHVDDVNVDKVSFDGVELMVAVSNVFPDWLMETLTTIELGVNHVFIMAGEPQSGEVSNVVGAFKTDEKGLPLDDAPGMMFVSFLIVVKPENARAN